MHQLGVEERMSKPPTAQAGACHLVSHQVLNSNMNATECKHPIEKKPFCLYLHIGSTVVFSKLAWSLSYNNHSFFRYACMCLIIILSLFLFETSSLCTLRLPWGITLIKPNTWICNCFQLHTKQWKEPSLTFMHLQCDRDPVAPQWAWAYRSRTRGDRFRLVLSSQLTAQGWGCRTSRGA